MYLADTTFIIDLVKGDSGALEKAKYLDKNHYRVSISTLSVHEYLRGVYYIFHSDEDLLIKKMAKAESDLSRFDIIDYNYEISKESSFIDGFLMSKGTIVSLADTIIGATARFYNFKVLTRNLKHFKQIPDLQTENY